MASHRPSETDSEVAKSIRSSSSSSSSSSDYSSCESEFPLEFMCSFGGQILPRRRKANQPCYVGGDTHILTVDHYTTFSSLLTELSNLAGNAEITVKYHLFDELISVTTDEEVESMMMMHRRLIGSEPYGSAPFLHLFLFSKDSPDVFSPTNARLSEQEEYPYQEVRPLVMEQKFLDLEELQQETIASTNIPLVSGRATGSVARSVSYKRLESSDAQKQPEIEIYRYASTIAKMGAFIFW